MWHTLCSMKASTALQSAINGKHVREGTDVPYHILAEWQRKPNWDLLTSITNLRFDVGELYECEGEIVAGGSGCLIVTIALPIIPDRGQTSDEFFFDKRKMEALKALKQRYGVARMWIRSKDKKVTVHTEPELN